MSHLCSISPRVASPLGAGAARDPHVATVEFFARHGVDLTQVDRSGWLACVSGSRSPGLSVLGCVQEHGAEFELMELEGGFRWSTHGSLHLAVARLLTDARVRARIDEARPLLNTGKHEDVGRTRVADA